MTRRARAVGLVFVLACAGCAVKGEPHAQVADDDAVPFALLEPDAPRLVSPTSGPVTESVPACFVRDGSLVVAPVVLPRPVLLEDVASALAEPPEVEGVALRTAVGDPSIVGRVQLRAGTAQVDLRPVVSTLGGDDQVLAVAQLVCTLTARPGVGQVSFTLDGAPVDVPRGDGSLTANPVSRDDYAALLG